MSVEVHIIDGPLLPAATWSPAGAGTLLCFEGVVRPVDNGRVLDALEYEVYEPMTRTELRKLADQVMRDHELIALRVEHGQGCVAVGECSFRLMIASAHRKAGLTAMDVFIDRMKQYLPIWKRPMWQV